jgi:ubiquinone/menaquinone biosynthesis C-methylase UbiE
MRRIDYDIEQHQNYVRARALTEAQLRTWITAFADVLPVRRPLIGLDLGSGTGRFTPALARAFGPAIGVEPSIRMREQAQAHAQQPGSAPGVRYLAGSAEEIPLPAASVDYAVLFLSWHHVPDKGRAVDELIRVLRPRGRLLLRGNFSDHHPQPWWLERVPSWRAADAAQFPSLHETIELFTARHWRVVRFGWVTEPSSGTLAESLDRLRLRSLSFFGQLDPEEIEVGMRSVEDFVEARPDVAAPTFAEPLLALERP